MSKKHSLRNVILGMFASLFAFCGVAVLGNQAQRAKAEEATETAENTSNIVTLMTPTDENAYKLNDNYLDGQYTIGVEDYASAPSGKVIHHTFDNRTITKADTWPAITVNAPCANAAEVTDFAGWVMWLEFNGEQMTDTNQYAAFQFANIDLNTTITFVDTNGKITTEIPRYDLFHCKYTEIPDSGYEWAFNYSFAGYVIIPKEEFRTDATLAETNAFKFTFAYTRTGYMDLKIGDIGYYTDYDALLQELGRCNYSFVDTDGTVVDQGQVQPGGVVTAPEYSNTYTKDGKVYEFIGWAGYTEGMTLTEDKVFKANYKVRNFAMVEGAGIRLVQNSAGIRFIAEFDEDLYNEVELDENKEFGMLITKLDYYEQALEQNADLISGLKALGGNKVLLITESSANPVKPYKHVEETNVTYRINGAITNIQYKNASTKWIGVGVVITTDAETGEVSYLYAAHAVETTARSTAYVASAALNDPTKNFSDSQKTILKNYVYETAAKLTDVAEADFDAAADKSVYLSGFEFNVEESLDVSKKFNTQVEGEEVYLTIGETVTVDASVKNAEGIELDLACKPTIGDSTVLELNGTELTALKNGYSTLSISNVLFGYVKDITVYTGSENAGTRKMGSNTGAQGTSSSKGEIAGQEYYWTQYDRDNGAQLYAAYTDISVYYIDYLISQGYKYLRVPFYFDTTRYEELGGTADQVTQPKFVIWMAKQLNGTSGGSSKEIKVPANEWCYYDMDLTHYRWNFTEVDYAGVDEYGFKTKITSGGLYHYMNMKFSCAYGYVHTAPMTFLKESTFTLNENNDEISFGENVNLSDWYNPNVVAKYTVDGVAMDSMYALNAEHAITVSSNIYTASIGDGSYEIGTSAGWAIKDCTQLAAIEKTMTVNGGIVDGGTTLVDVKDVTADVSLSENSKATALEGLGFTVTQSYVKRYSDGTPLAENTVENKERGIFYATVSADNGTQSIEYDVTLDLYNSTEAVEYESFGHADSSYAVKLWYYANGVGALTGSGKTSYEYVSTTYTQEAGKGMPMSVGDTYVSLKAFGDHKNDTTNNANVTAVYGHTTIHYVAIDQSTIKSDTPLVQEMGNATSAINIYVTPRHSKLYYEEAAKNNTGVMKYAYAAGCSATSHQTKRYSLQDVNNGVATLSYKDAWSAAWQSWAYTNTDTGKQQSVTLEKLVANYDAFCNNQFPIYISEDPHGRGETALNDGVAKLGSILF